MEKIAILYHSGVGNTKKISEKISTQLAKYYDAEMHSVEKLPEDFDGNHYIALVIGFPVIHTHPSIRILRFIDSMESLAQPKAAYIFATCGWYSANSVRILAKRCVSKNIIPVAARVYNGCPATDGTLLFPSVKSFFTFPQNLDAMIEQDAAAFCQKVETGIIALSMPKFKMYSILNYPNKLLGQLITCRIYVHKHKCIKCNKCTANCPSSALTRDSEDYPYFVSAKCEKCYRCIHHCPQLALSLSKKKPPKAVLGG